MRIVHSLYILDSWDLGTQIDERIDPILIPYVPRVGSECPAVNSHRSQGQSIPVQNANHVSIQHCRGNHQVPGALTDLS